MPEAGPIRSPPFGLGAALSGGGVRDWTGDAAVVGLVEVLKKYPYFKEEFDRALEATAKFAPDIVVLVDYPGFNGNVLP